MTEITVTDPRKVAAALRGDTPPPKGHRILQMAVYEPDGRVRYVQHLVTDAAFAMLRDPTGYLRIVLPMLCALTEPRR